MIAEGCSVFEIKIAPEIDSKAARFGAKPLHSSRARRAYGIFFIICIWRNYTACSICGTAVWCSNCRLFRAFGCTSFALFCSRAAEREYIRTHGA
jgi:hypothetical protein